MSVTIKDVARSCGLSISTVSKVFNGYPDISEVTRRQVMEAAHEIGYRPNALARALKTNRSYNLGVLFVDENISGLMHPFFAAVLNAFKAEAETWGYDITFINHNIGTMEMTYLEHCRYRNVDGVCLACVDFYSAEVAELVNSDIPCVTIDHMFNNRISVMSDNFRGMDALVRHVISRGHRKIALIHGEKTSVTVNRLTGFHRACEELGVRIPEKWIREGVFHDPSSCYIITKEILSAGERPTCIFFPDDYSYIGGYNAIQEAGLRIPEDISVVGYDGIPLSRIVSPVLTTWRQNTGGLGRTAARALIDLIEHPKTSILDRVIVEGSLQEGGSVKDLRETLSR